jgi:hypothetical protein
LKNVRPEPLPNKDLKVKVNKQKPNITSARTVAGSEQKLKLPTSRHNIAKPFDRRSLFIYVGSSSRQQIFQQVFSSLF